MIGPSEPLSVLHPELEALVSSLPHCQAAGLVDLATGEILAMSQLSAIDPDTAVMIGASIHDLFKESRFEHLEAAGGSANSPVDELVYLCADLAFVFVRASRGTVLFLTGSAGANLGLLQLRGQQTATVLEQRIKEGRR